MNWGLMFPLLALALAADEPVPSGAPLPSCTIDEGDVIRSRPYRECVDLLPMEVIRGTWFVGLEESSFLPEGQPLPAVRVVSEQATPAEMATWLDVGWPKLDEILANVPGPGGEGDTNRYTVEFLGRRAREPGEYGHGGLARHLIVTDRMLSIAPAGRVRTRIELGETSCWVEECSQVQAEARAREAK
jgi:hypothetical protein